VNGGCDHKFTIGVESLQTNVMSEAWLIYCRPGTNFQRYTSISV